MIIALTIELAIAWTLLASRDPRTVVLGACLAMAYAYYSATWAACARFIRWWNDRNTPPPGAA